MTRSYKNQRRIEQDYHDNPQASPATLDGYLHLAAAILQAAVCDARAGSLEAILWLADVQAEAYADALGLSNAPLQAAAPLLANPPKRQSVRRRASPREVSYG